MKLGDFFANLRRKRADDDEPARFAAPVQRAATRAANVLPYHAVSVRPGLMCCPQSRKVRGIRFLSRAAPSIPLPGCTMSKECTCRFQKHNDRREGDRRLFGTDPDSRYFLRQRASSHGRAAQLRLPSAGKLKTVAAAN